MGCYTSNGFVKSLLVNLVRVLGGYYNKQSQKQTQKMEAKSDSVSSSEQFFYTQ